MSATALASLSIALSACGGSGNSGVNSPSSTPVSNPTPTPTPTQPNGPIGTTAQNTVITTANQQAIYNQSTAGTINANAGYNVGATGAGVTIAILDTGIDVNNPAFAGRISSASQSMPQINSVNCSGCAIVPSETLPLQDQIGHGTEVASIAAGANTGKGMQGVAPAATILAINISGVEADDSSGNPVTASTPQSTLVAGGGTGVSAAALNAAINNGAFVISISSTGADPSTFLNTPMHTIAVQNLLVVQSVSNNIGEDSYAGQIAQDLVGAQQQYAPWFLFGIRAQTAPSQNGNPGALASRTLAVSADNVLADQIGGGTTTVSGNSFAAPAISGAAALLKSYWPQLGGYQIAQILLQTADAPTSATSVTAGNVSGFPLLDLTNAFTPQALTIGTSVPTPTIVNPEPLSGTDGATATPSSVKSSTTTAAAAKATLPPNATVTVQQLDANGKPVGAPVTTKVESPDAGQASVASTSLVFSPAFGSANAQAKFAAATGQTVTMDAYGRDFKIATGSLAHNYTSPGTVLYGQLQLQKPQTFTSTAGSPGFLSYANTMSGSDPDLPIQTNAIAPSHTAPLATMVLPITKSASITMSANGSVEDNQLISGSMYRNLGITTFGSTFEFDYTGYKVRLSSASNVGQLITSTTTAPYSPANARSSLTEATITFKNGISVGMSSAVEYGSALGLLGNGAFTVSGAHSAFAKLGWNGNVKGFHVSAEAMVGTTTVDGQSDMIQFTGPVRTSGFRLTAQRSFANGELTLGLTSPLRVDHAGMSYTGPTSYDYKTNTFTLNTENFDVGASAREMDLEANWAKPIGTRGSLSLGATLTANTGNEAGLTTGAAWLRYNTKF